MDVAALTTELFDRIHGLVPAVLADLSPDQLAERPGGANPVGWLVWHLARVTDDHLAGGFGTTQAWDDGWRERCGLDLEPHAIGYGMDDAEVDRVRVPADLLLGYHEAVHARFAPLLAEVTEDDLDRVVDEAWDPPVTLGVRIVSVASDCLQHLGQAAYVRGMLLS